MSLRIVEDGLTLRVGSEMKDEYAQSLAQLIAAGNYDHVDVGIADLTIGQNYFDVEDKEVALFRVDTRYEYDRQQVTTRMADAGYKPAGDWELLLFGVKYPDRQDLWGIRTLDLYHQNGYTQRIGLGRTSSWGEKIRRLQLFGTPQWLRVNVNRFDRVLGVRL